MHPLMSPAEIRQHLKEVEAEFLLAVKEDRVTEVLVRDYIRASDAVERLGLWRAEYVNQVGEGAGK